MKNWHKEATKSQVLISYNVCTARWGGGGGGEGHAVQKKVSVYLLIP